MDGNTPESPAPEAVSAPAQGPPRATPDQVQLPAQPAAASLKPQTTRPDDPPPRTRRALVLFLLTCLSTLLVGFYQGPVIPDVYFVNLLRAMNRAELWERLGNGLTYATCLMAILGAHELGHYLQARRFGVPASPPFFIPFPISPFGTMGAVIVQRPGIADRKMMFDIAISGPLAGLVVALPMTCWGILQSKVLPIPDSFQGISYGDPLLLQWMIHAVLGKPIPAGHDIFMHPMLFAGWVGIFITALNLIPIGQLDGGHILYRLILRRAHFWRGLFLLAAGAIGCAIFIARGRQAAWALIMFPVWMIGARQILFLLIRRRAPFIARGLFLVGACVVVFWIMSDQGRYAGWSLMLFLIWMLGTEHPRTANDRVPLGPARVWLGWLTLLFVFIGLTPTPIAEYHHIPKPRPQVPRQMERSPLDRR